MPAAPAAPFKCPMFDLTEPSGTERGARPDRPKTASRLSTSITSPTRVEVPCPSINPTVPGARPAFSQARSTAMRWPAGLGAVIPLPRPSLAPPTPRITA
jgi:hypothetical protein